MIFYIFCISYLYNQQDSHLICGKVKPSEVLSCLGPQAIAQVSIRLGSEQKASAELLEKMFDACVRDYDRRTQRGVQVKIQSRC